MGEETAVENGRMLSASNNFKEEYQGLVTLTLTLYRVILHTIIHISTSTKLSNFIEIEKTLWKDGQTDGRTFETHFIRLTRRSRPKKRQSLMTGPCLASFTQLMGVTDKQTDRRNYGSIFRTFKNL